MITQTDYNVLSSTLQEAADHLPKNELRPSINEPTGDFFYDPWKLKDKYKDTIWEAIYDSLPVEKGEARIIDLQPATVYQQHADIDDRYHLNITGEACYLFDFDNNAIHNIVTNGIWYMMDAGRLHSAGNLGRVQRSQLVIRKLLNRTSLKEPIKVKIISIDLGLDDSRFIFDQTVSKWLNYANKKSFISDFKFNKTSVEFHIEQSQIDSLKLVLTKNFKLEIL